MKKRTVYVCGVCGNQSLKWIGHCPGCNEWNTYSEEVITPIKTTATSTRAEELSSVCLSDTPRIPVQFSEFNRVLGGGIVPGSLILIGGDPGIGKSTLLLQITTQLAKNEEKVLYVSGEESLSQIKLRADRLGIEGDSFFVLPETRMESIMEQAEALSPKLAVIDSIQTVYLEGAGIAGSLSQVRECTLRLMQWSKSSGIPVFLVGHVTKDGTIAGPRVLEHMVDVVLYLEGERFSTYRLLRGVKNRFGSTNEIGIFEMHDKGLVEVSDPSKALLSQRSEGTVGSVIVPTLEGTRPLLIEIQALTNPTTFGLPRRTANGIDFNRLLIVLAVLSRRGGLSLSNQDVIANIAGGIKIGEPALDLGLAIAITSSLRNITVDSGMVAIGEIGLSGELRAVSQIERRLSEAARFGFKTCLLPEHLPPNVSIPSRISVKPAETLTQALKIAFE